MKKYFGFEQEKLSAFYDEMILKYFRLFAEKYLPEIDKEKIDLAFAESVLRLADANAVQDYRADFAGARSFLEKRDDMKRFFKKRNNPAFVFQKLKRFFCKRN